MGSFTVQASGRGPFKPAQVSTCLLVFLAAVSDRHSHTAVKLPEAQPQGLASSAHSEGSTFPDTPWPREYNMPVSHVGDCKSNLCIKCIPANAAVFAAMRRPCSLSRNLNSELPPLPVSHESMTVRSTFASHLTDEESWVQRR